METFFTGAMENDELVLYKRRRDEVVGAQTKAKREMLRSMYWHFTEGWISAFIAII